MQRYDWDEDEDSEGDLHIIGMTESEHGEWVKWYDAHAALVIAAKAAAGLSADLAAANARVAELESADREAAKCIRELSDERDAANARADENCAWATRAESEAAALRASLDAADRAGLALAKQLDEAERKVIACRAVLSRRYSEPGHWENPAGDLCSADELEAALEDK
jgi:chromosome segregation ATPase